MCNSYVGMVTVERINELGDLSARVSFGESKNQLELVVMESLNHFKVLSNVVRRVISIAKKLFHRK